MSEYFNKFPLINYDNNRAINILARVAVRKDIQKDQSIYYPLTIQDSERPDMVAYDYYGDSNYDWLLYYANDTIDPLFEFPLDQSSLDSYIKKKYGSLENAMNTIKFYQLRSNPGIIINTESLIEQDNINDWWGVSAYNYEIHLNDLKMTKYVIRNNLASKIAEELEAKLKG